MAFCSHCFKRLLLPGGISLAILALFLVWLFTRQPSQMGRVDAFIAYTAMGMGAWWFSGGIGNLVDRWYYGPPTKHDDGHD
jgi:lipoprotein signal peptidase